MVSFFGSKPQQVEPGFYNRPSGWAENHEYLLGLVLVVATLALYYPVHHYPFFSVDDFLYVTGDPHVLGALNWSTVKWAFTHTFVLNYDPLTFFAHSLNVQMFQLEPGRHHAVNVVLHLSLIHISIVLLAMTVLKVFLVDISTLERGYRIAAFIVLGAILLAVSFFYQRSRTKSAA